MKSMKKFASLFLALAVVFSLAAPAFAAEARASTTVTIVLQQKPEGAEAPAAIDTVTVSIEAGQSVYDAVNALPKLVQVAEDPANPGQPANCTWKTVDVLDPETWLPTGEKAHALNSISYKDGRITTEYTNNGSSVVNPDDPTHGSYSGTAWGYTVDGTAPNGYMDQYPLNGGETIVLSYDFSSFDW